MEKVGLLVFGLSLGLLAASLLGLFFWPSPASMMMQMMPDMFVIMFWPTLLGASIITLIVGGIFYTVYRLPSATGHTSSEHPPDNSAYATDIISRFLKPDEQKVVETLRQAGGSLLQKEIARQTGFTRLKTHRILARLAERQVIEVEWAGNTNKITLPRWLKETVRARKTAPVRS